MDISRKQLLDEIENLRQCVRDYNKIEDEQKQLIEKLALTEKRFLGTLDAMLEGCQIIGYDWRYLYINPVAATQGRYDKEKYIGRTMMEIYPGIEKSEMFKSLRKCMEERIPERMENEFTYPDGNKGWFVLRLEPVPEGILVLSTDITDSKKSESEIKRINRILRAISECNQVLVRTTDEKELLNRICNIIVKFVDYPLAWVGFAENDEEKTVRPAAQAGDEPGYLDSLKISWDDNEFGRGPTGTAIRTRKPCIISNTMVDPDYAPWRVSAEKYGYKSSIALPLISDGFTIGSLNIYAVDEGAFNEEQVKLLTELADDLAYGITALRKHQELELATQSLVRSEKKYSTLVEQSNDGIIIIQEGILKFVNRKMVEMTGVPTDESLDKPFLDFVSPQNRELVLDRYTRRMAGEEVVNSYEIEIVKKDGKGIPVELNAGKIEHEGRPADMIIIRDKTERKKAEEALKESEERYRNLAQSTREIIQSIGRDGNILFVNKAWHDILGYSEEDLKNITLMDIIHPDSLEHCSRMFQKVLSGRSVTRVEAKFKAKDGRIIYVEGNAVPRFFGDTVIATQGFFNDVTERKKAEEVLYRSERKLRKSLKDWETTFNSINSAM
ncbi:MAG: PAS domain S-box protein, partial [Dehalococcoidales bacterium]|nr:PAS domain S-box protein [Dehalococcoidales bacterium]